MKVLFVPAHHGLGHFIPLVALDRMFRAEGIETAFLLAPRFLPFAAAAGLRVLTTRYTGELHSEIRGYREFGPDVVVDDFGFTTGYATTIQKVPRVAIRRLGIFPFRKPANPGHRHSLHVDMDRLPDVTSWGLERPRTFEDFFRAAAYIVPAIRSVEALPEPLRGDPSYFYSGPLIVEDHLWGRPDAGDAAQTGPRDFSSLDRFFAANRDRDVVYFTYGLEARAGAPIVECMRYLLDRGAALVTSIPSPELMHRYPDRYYLATYLPMHHVCSRVKLAVHHCGSAAYHYPLMHELPAITIGTQAYDRDDVGIRLEELGVSRHLPAPEECDGFVDRFAELAREALEDAGARAAGRARAAELNREIERTRAEFDPLAVLRHAVDAHRAAGARPAIVAVAARPSEIAPMPLPR